MIGVIVGSKKMGINPDNVATPIAASLGDLITLALLSGISWGLYKELGEEQQKKAKSVSLVLAGSQSHFTLFLCNHLPWGVGGSRSGAPSGLVQVRGGDGASHCLAHLLLSRRGAQGEVGPFQGLGWGWSSGRKQIWIPSAELSAPAGDPQGRAAAGASQFPPSSSSFLPWDTGL